MKVVCGYCGQTTEVNGLGRKPKAMPVINICDTLQLYRSVPLAAEKLGCSRALIYKILKTNGLTVKDVINKKE